jgi:hypothetical protein
MEFGENPRVVEKIILKPMRNDLVPLLYRETIWFFPAA